MKLTEHIYWVGSGEFGLSHFKDCHVYLIPMGQEAVLIDSGCGIDTTELCRNIEQVLPVERISHIFLTHGHADHSGAAAAFQARCGCTVHASPAEKRLVETGDEDALGLTLAKKKGAYPQDYIYPPCTVDDEVVDGAVYRFGGITLESILVPGHSPGGVCYLLRTPNGVAAFTGDTVFLNGYVSIINCPGCDLDAYRTHIGKLANLGVDALFPGHGSWTLQSGQAHLDMAVRHFATSAMPPIR